MANKKITELDAITTLASTDVVPVVDVSADTTNKITTTNLFRTLPDGTAAAPALAFSSDQANGVYLAGTDTVGISTGGTQRVTVDGSGNVTISGDLQVDGATTTVQSTTVTIDDKNIELGSVASPSNTTDVGGGITLKGATDKTLKWINGTGCWTFNQPMNFNDHVRIDSSGRLGVGTNSPGCQTGGIHAVHANNEGTPSFTGGEVAIFQRNFNNAQGCHVGIIGGTTGTSSINFGDKDDADVGIIQYGHSDNSMRFFTNTGERMRIDTAGRVGIGTSSPGCELEIGGNGHIHLANQGRVGCNSGSGAPSDAYIKFFDDDIVTICTTDTERLRVDSNGRVGIGTTSPGNTLHLKGAQGVGIRFENSTSTNSSYLTIESGDKYQFNVGGSGYYTWVTGGSEKVRINSSGDVGVNTTSPTQKIDAEGNILARDNGNTNGALLSNDGCLEVYRSDSVPFIDFKTSDAEDFDCRIQQQSNGLAFTTGGNGSTYEQMRITSHGDLGIGTSSTRAKLDVRGNGSLGPTNTTDQYQGLSFINGKDSSGALTTSYIDFKNDELIADSHIFANHETDGSSNLVFGTTPAGSRTTDRRAERMRIDSLGRLIVGATGGTGKFIVQDSSLPKIQSNYNGTKHMEFGTGGSGCGFAMTTGHFMSFNHQPYADRGTDNNLTERMRLHSGGGVSIGTTATPTAKSPETAIRLGTSTLGHHTFTNLSTTVTDITAASGIGGLAFVQAYNTANGAQYVGLFMWRYGHLIAISENNNTGLTLNFSVSTNKLRLATSSGTVTGSVITLQAST